MKLLRELLGESFADTKRDTGYYETFIPVNLAWLDGILHFLRYEKPFENNPKVDKFASKVEDFFNQRYGKMVYHKKDDKAIGRIINTNWKELQKNPTSDQVKLQISFTNQELNKLKRSGVIAPEGAHSGETDFWVDQRDKERINSRRSMRR